MSLSTQVVRVPQKTQSFPDSKDASLSSSPSLPLVAVPSSSPSASLSSLSPPFSTHHRSTSSSSLLGWDSMLWTGTDRDSHHSCTADIFVPAAIRGIRPRCDLRIAFPNKPSTNANFLQNFPFAVLLISVLCCLQHGVADRVSALCPSPGRSYSFTDVVGHVSVCLTYFPYQLTFCQTKECRGRTTLIFGPFGKQAC